MSVFSTDVSVCSCPRQVCQYVSVLDRCVSISVSSADVMCRYVRVLDRCVSMSVSLTGVSVCLCPLQMCQYVRVLDRCVSMTVSSTGVSVCPCPRQVCQYVSVLHRCVSVRSAGSQSRRRQVSVSDLSRPSSAASTIDLSPDDCAPAFPFDLDSIPRTSDASSTEPDNATDTSPLL